MRIVLSALLAAALIHVPPGYAQPQRAGDSVAALPEGSIPITYGRSRYYFSAGTWFQEVIAGFVVVTPPEGIVVPALPPRYTTTWLAGVPYYGANGIFYTAAPGGYVVVAPPAGQGGIYYCASTRAYFPGVPDCPEGWTVVPTVPPQLRK